MSLPALVVFSVSDSNKEVRYLSFTGPQRQLRFGPEEGVFSDIARFAVESAGDGLVHIRSCYDNFYWARASKFEPWLLASNREKVEDLSKDECTLFRQRMIGAGNVFVSFVHAGSGLNVVMRPTTDAHAYNLCVEHGAPTEFTYTDYAPLRKIRLPRYVIFRGDNDRYLGVRKSTETAGYPQFSYDHYSTSRDVAFEVFYNKSGDNVRIPNVGSTGELEFTDAATNVTTSWNWRTDYLPIIAKEAVSLKIPPMTRLTAMLSVSTAIYEVPFSYQQIDELPYGGTQTQHLHDGVFKIETEYGASFSYSDIRSLTSEVLDDDNIYTDFRALDLEGINVQDDGIEAKASGEVNQE